PRRRGGGRGSRGGRERRPYDEPHRTPEELAEAEARAPRREPTSEEALRGPRDTAEAVAELEETAGGRRTSEPSDLRYRQGAGTAMERGELTRWADSLRPGEELVPRGEFGRGPNRWMRDIFPGNDRPDGIIVDTARRRITVADVTSSPHVEHIEKSVNYGRRLAELRQLIPEHLRDFAIYVEERYWEHGVRPLRPIRIFR
ncbi:MAG TPA: hypothetical protein VFX98_02740, partial [Longimicrobiaceae bacterium]|nr:hypothetical protein [Longimicrobiaceae bacterium]